MNAKDQGPKARPKKSPRRKREGENPEKVEADNEEQDCDEKVSPYPDPAEKKIPERHC
jgi:hypothetical protein